ncbi:MAG: helix-turn-helix transcriptional regulator [Desulfosporosinus sp.]|nr:helix-turn-helix transcriptional regulator [Desulfosporosinus sp.]
MRGKRIAQLRKGMGWTQKELSEVTGLSRGYIAAIEAGKDPGIRALAVIAEALGIKVSELYEAVRQITP